jgi:hypothetical protein
MLAGFSPLPPAEQEPKMAMSRLPGFCVRWIRRCFGRAVRFAKYRVTPRGSDRTVEHRLRRRLLGRAVETST